MLRLLLLSLFLTSSTYAAPKFPNLDVRVRDKILKPTVAVFAGRSMSGGRYSNSIILMDKVPQDICDFSIYEMARRKYVGIFSSQFLYTRDTPGVKAKDKVFDLYANVSLVGGGCDFNLRFCQS